MPLSDDGGLSYAEGDGDAADEDVVKVDSEVAQFPLPEFQRAQGSGESAAGVSEGNGEGERERELKIDRRPTKAASGNLQKAYLRIESSGREDILVDLL
ncbi:unnamed protein product [Linum trigynum]|uniref:Uncharacterized protein n=1 Tax=Linum trigynum TaxID=586398 RepID=A0AAV2CVX2_9ROSI